MSEAEHTGHRRDPNGEERSLATDIGVWVAPTLAAGAAWALDKYGSGTDEPPPDPPQDVILPPGVDKD